MGLIARVELPRRRGKPLLRQGTRPAGEQTPGNIIQDEVAPWRKRVEDAITAVSRQAETLVGLPPERSAFAE